MSKPFTPRAYQRPMIDHILDLPRGALWAGLGTGKTVAALTAIDTLQLAGMREPALVLAPLRVAEHTWTNETGKWDHLSGMDVSAIVGTPAQREAALRQVLRGEAGVGTINYDNLPWLLEKLDGKWPFGMVVADESTRLKSFRGGFRTHPTSGKTYYQGGGGTRARALGRVAHKTERFVNLTGTPASNGLQDLWGQQWFIDAGQRLGRTHEAFIQRWFSKGHNGFSLEPLPFAEEQIHAALSDVCLTVDIRDYYDIGEPVRSTVEVELPAKARALYRDMERKMFMELAGREVEAVHAAAKTIKLLQICNGAAFVDEDSTVWEEIHDAKLQALDSIVEEANGAPVLVAYHFKPDLARLKRTFKHGIDLSTGEGLRRAMKGEGRVWFAHPMSLGHGVDGLQEHCNQIAFFGHWWSLENRQQIIERVGPTRQMQAGKDRPVFVYDIIAADTVDELVMERHETKRSTQDILLAAMKRKKLI
ncbi:MAG TPA: hypothetical protein PL098_00130 [Brevundimonas diminuta]|nr:hypothetical protein [Brevundimonas diminuta]HRL23311.1 hypothetical protein [Brevundimonas diminuta]